MYDAWFCRLSHGLVFGYGPAGEPPTHVAKTNSVAEALRWMKIKGYEVAQVGIADREMLGL